MIETAEERFNRLIAEHGAALRRLTVAYEFDASERDDLLQDIAFSLWRALPSFRAECSERTFVYRVAHNTAVSHNRRAAARQRLVELDDAANHRDPFPTPDQYAAYSALQERLATAVRVLSPALCEAIVLSLEGLSNLEIAEVLGVSPGAVAVRVNRARAELARLLAAFK